MNISEIRIGLSGYPYMEIDVHYNYGLTSLEIDCVLLPLVVPHSIELIGKLTTFKVEYEHH